MMLEVLPESHLKVLQGGTPPPVSLLGLPGVALATRILELEPSNLAGHCGWSLLARQYSLCGWFFIFQNFIWQPLVPPVSFLFLLV